MRACDYRPFDSPWGTPRARRPDDRELEIVELAQTGRRAHQPPGTVAIDTDAGAYVATGDRWVHVTGLRLDGQSRDPTEVLGHGQVLEGASDPARR